MSRLPNGILLPERRLRGRGSAIGLLLVSEDLYPISTSLLSLAIHCRCRARS
jgi:hypothetical protein